MIGRLSLSQRPGNPANSVVLLEMSQSFRETALVTKACFQSLLFCFDGLIWGIFQLYPTVRTKQLRRHPRKTSDGKCSREKVSRQCFILLDTCEDWFGHITYLQRTLLILSFKSCFRLRGSSYVNIPSINEYFASLFNAFIVVISATMKVWICTPLLACTFVVHCSSSMNGQLMSCLDRSLVATTLRSKPFSALGPFVDCCCSRRYH